MERPAPRTGRLHVDAASDNSWKTWAGRTEGAPDFAFSDLYNGFSLSLKNIHRQWKADTRSNSKPCPVCFDEDPPVDALGKRWMRLYCGCTVCSTCVRHWNVTQMEGDAPEAVTKFSCPVCRSNMRPADAEQTLARCLSVARRHDLQTRDAALRGMTDAQSGLQEWHPCPHCKRGGGFITAECIAARHAMVRSKVEAQELQALWHTVAAAEAATEVQQMELDQARENQVWFARHATSRLEETAAVLAGAPLATVLAALAGMPRWVVGIAAGVALPLLLGHQLAAPQEDVEHTRLQKQAVGRVALETRAAEEQALADGQRTAIAAARAQLLDVGCPCCEASFHLPESSLEHFEGKLSACEWLDTNTRGCPQCGVAIQKNGGCDHMNCSQVVVSFSHCRPPIRFSLYACPRRSRVACRYVFA